MIVADDLNVDRIVLFLHGPRHLQSKQLSHPILSFRRDSVLLISYFSCGFRHDFVIVKRVGGVDPENETSGMVRRSS